MALNNRSNLIENELLTIPMAVNKKPAGNQITRQVP
jgi:hypothetical protein